MRASLLLLVLHLHVFEAASAVDGNGNGQQALYDEMYATDYKAVHWAIGGQAALLSDLLLSADNGLLGLDAPAVVLDAGSGRGAVLHWLENVQKFRAIECYGIELSQTAVASTPWPELLRENKFVHGSLQAIPWQDNQFDLVYSHEVLEHIPAADIPAVLSELVRVSKGRLVLTISLRLAGKDDPLAPHLHVTVKSRRWWDDQFARCGCYPDLDLLGFLWRDERSQHDTHFPWEPYREPWIFAYVCPKPVQPAEALGQLSRMRAAVPQVPLPIHGDTLGERAGCHLEGWCDLFHPSIYAVTEEALASLHGGTDVTDRVRAPAGGWLRERHMDLVRLCLDCTLALEYCKSVCASFSE